MVITRYGYKSWASMTDNRRWHIYVVTLADKKVRALTKGPQQDHSIAWSPKGDEIAYISNHEPDPDRVHNYDIFAVQRRRWPRPADHQDAGLRVCTQLVGRRIDDRLSRRRTAGDDTGVERRGSPRLGDPREGRNREAACEVARPPRDERRLGGRQLQRPVHRAGSAGRRPCTASARMTAGSRR